MADSRFVFPLERRNTFLDLLIRQQMLIPLVTHSDRMCVYTYARWPRQTGRLCMKSNRIQIFYGSNPIRNFLWIKIKYFLNFTSTSGRQGARIWNRYILCEPECLVLAVDVLVFIAKRLHSIRRLVTRSVPGMLQPRVGHMHRCGAATFRPSPLTAVLDFVTIAVNNFSYVYYIACRFRV